MKLGDSVRIKDGFYVGKIGTITDVKFFGLFYEVIIYWNDDNGTEWKNTMTCWKYGLCPVERKKEGFKAKLYLIKDKVNK